MGAEQENFCLRWSDFESNLSAAFQELRSDADFFDVTLATDEDQVGAHRVVLSACSPHLKEVLRKHAKISGAKANQNLLVYMRGVRHSDLLAVLEFMYCGSVNVAQEDLNSFLAVAEDLKVRGLTQNLATKDTERTPASNSTKNGTGVGKRSKPSTAPAPPAPSPTPQKRMKLEAKDEGAIGDESQYPPEEQLEFEYEGEGGGDGIIYDEADAAEAGPSDPEAVKGEFDELPEIATDEDLQSFLSRGKGLPSWILPRNRKSKVWDYFLIPTDGDLRGKAKCSRCQVVMKASTTSLRYHLQRQHGVDFPDDVPADASAAVESPSNSWYQPVNRRSTVWQYFLVPTDKELRSKKSKCSLCSAVMTMNTCSTSSLRHHLENIHGINLAETEPEFAV